MTPRSSISQSASWAAGRSASKYIASVKAGQTVARGSCRFQGGDAGSVVLVVRVKQRDERSGVDKDQKRPRRSCKSFVKRRQSSRNAWGFRRAPRLRSVNTRVRSCERCEGPESAEGG